MKYALIIAALLLVAPVAAIDNTDLKNLFGNEVPEFVVGERAAVGDVRAAIAINEPFAGPNNPFKAAALDKDTLPGRTAQIVLGGPCINTVAASLLDNPEQCAAGFEPGKAIVRMFRKNGHPVLLVAGYNEADTLYAAQYVKTHSLPANADLVLENPNAQQY